MKAAVLKSLMLGAVLTMALQCQVALAAYGSIALRRDQIVDVHDGDTITISVQEWPGVFGHSWACV